MMKRTSRATIVATLAIAACAGLVALAPTAQATELYWDANGTEPGFGDTIVGTWGTDSYWTTDSSGLFADTPGTATTTAADILRVNMTPVNNFQMDVSGDVHAYNIVNLPSHVTDTTINGPGTIHVHTSGLGDANAVLSGHNDLKVTVNPNLVLEAAGGSTVALHDQGGNNSTIWINGSITSTNTVDLYYNDPGKLFLNDAVDLQGGNFITESGGSWRPKHHEMADGVLGSGVHHVYRSGPQGGHGGDKGRLVLGADQAYTGDTFLDTSVIRLTADTSLPSTTSVFITGVESDVTDGLMELFFAGTNVISGLHFWDDDNDVFVAQAFGTWGAVGNGFSEYESGFFTGTGTLLVAAPTLDGDTNDDGVVDAADYIAVKMNMGQASGAVLADGDFNEDGKVDWYDLQILQDHYGETSAAGGTIPEPGTLALLALGGLAALRRRRNK